MPFEILMPALSPTMTEGSLAKWLKKEGDKIKSGDLLAEIETDKAIMELEAIDEGTLGKLLVPEGTAAVAVNTPIAVMLAAGEIVSDLAATKRQAPAANTPTPLSPPKPHRASEPDAHDARIFASPLARRLAKEAHVDLARVNGSGPNGRIVAANIEEAKKIARAVEDAVSPATQGQAAYREIPLSNLRKTIAKRLTEAKQTVPHFYLTIDCTVDKLLALRGQINGGVAAQETDAKVSINDFLIKAAAIALREAPGANASFTETAIREYADVDISVAIATPAGLIAPVVRKADAKTLLQISAEMKGLVARGRDGKLRPEELQGGSFSISNLGMYGVKHFEAIINPPQGCILAVGACEQRPAVVKGELQVSTQMSCTLSVDHRVVDGALGAEFLRAFKTLIEKPVLMLL